jgi:hypothetical protein
MQESKTQSLFTGYGEACLFEEPIQDVSALAEWNREVPDFLKRIESGGDNRSICIMASLVAEYHVDRLLKIVFPKFKPLEDGGMSSSHYGLT